MDIYSLSVRCVQEHKLPPRNIILLFIWSFAILIFYWNFSLFAEWSFAACVWRTVLLQIFARKRLCRRVAICRQRSLPTNKKSQLDNCVGRAIEPIWRTHRYYYDYYVTLRQINYGKHILPSRLCNTSRTDGTKTMAWWCAIHSPEYLHSAAIDDHNTCQPHWSDHIQS